MEPGPGMWAIARKSTYTYVIEHLERVRRGCNLKWKYPTTEDIQVVQREINYSIVKLTVTGMFWLIGTCALRCKIINLLMRNLWN